MNLTIETKFCSKTLIDFIILQRRKKQVNLQFKTKVKFNSGELQVQKLILFYHFPFPLLAQAFPTFMCQSFYTGNSTGIQNSLPKCLPVLKLLVSTALGLFELKTFHKHITRTDLPMRHSQNNKEQAHRTFVKR